MTMFCFLYIIHVNIVLHSVVCIATSYGLDSPGIKSPSWWDFPHPSGQAVGPTHTPTRWGLGLFPGVKQPRHGIDHPPPIWHKRRVLLCPISPSKPSRSVLGWTLPVPSIVLDWALKLYVERIPVSNIGECIRCIDWRLSLLSSVPSSRSEDNTSI